MRIQFHTTENNLHEIKKAILKKFFKIGSFLIFKFIIWSEKDSKLNLNSKIAFGRFYRTEKCLKNLFYISKIFVLTVGTRKFISTSSVAKTVAQTNLPNLKYEKPLLILNRTLS